MTKSNFQNSKSAIIEKSSSGMFISLFKGIIAAYTITIPAFIIFSLILTYTDFPEKLIQTTVVVITIISVFLAGYISSKGKNKGWLSGALIGLIYIVVLYILSSLVYNNYSFDKYVLTMTMISTLTGVIGGIMGVNMGVKHGSKYKHKR